MDAQLEPLLAANAGSRTPETETLVATKNEVPASNEQIPRGGKQDAPGRRQRYPLQRIGSVAVLLVILAFTTGLLLGSQLPRQRVQQIIYLRRSLFRDSREELPQLGAPALPLAQPEKAEATLATSQVGGANLPPTPQLLLYDLWGLPYLDHFEKALPPALKQGKEDLASLLQTSCSCKDEPNKLSQFILKNAAIVISGGKEDNLVGLTISLRDVKPIKPRTEGSEYAPLSLRVTKVLTVGYPSVVMEVEDEATGHMYTARIRVFSARGIQTPQDEEMLLASTQGWADSEEVIARQIAGGTPAHLVAEQKGLAVPLYVGNVANVPDVTLHEGFYFFSRVQISQRLHGEFNLGSLVKSGLSMRAKEYIAARLLQIVLKLQQALLSHNDLDWTNLHLSPDGSFLLSGFDASIPFGKAIGVHIRLSGRHLEPTLRIQEDVYAEDAVPQATSDLWSLGMLFYELFTGGNVPYTEDERDYLEYALPMAKYLIDKEVDPVELVSDLDAANCPVRWKQLTLKLLQPVRGARITTWGILTEFPDLASHRLPR